MMSPAVEFEQKKSRSDPGTLVKLKVVKKSRSRAC